MKNILFLTCLILFVIAAHAQNTSELWGTSELGGPDGAGSIMKMNLDGSGETDVFDFETPFPGAMPLNVVEAPNGKLYGTTSLGGTHGKGVLYCYRPSSGIYEKLYNFDSGNSLGTTSGSFPSKLMQSANGKLYGVTYKGGVNDIGALYSLDTNSNICSKIFDFGAGVNGVGPSGNLVQASNGKLYGTTDEGGANNAGVLFSMDLTSNTYTKLMDFGGIIGNNLRAPGYVGHPGTLIVGSNGKLYGTIIAGGVNNAGVLFSFDPSSNTYSKLFDFSAANGASPDGIIIQASDGKLYGKTQEGGVNNGGVFYGFDLSSNTYINIATSGGNTTAGLMEVNGGKLFGTMGGGANGGGVLFSYVLSTSTYSTLAVTSPSPIGQIIQLSNGNLYGITSPSSGSGTIFSFDPSTATYNSLFEFDDINGLYHGPYLKGAYPQCLIKSSDGKLYGVAQNGGTTEVGVLFSFDPTSNTYSKHFDFDACANGQQPRGILLPASNGKLYGVAVIGGANNAGVIYSLDPSSNTFQKLFDFDINNGYVPVAGLMQASNGKLYGMTFTGGDNGGPYPHDGGVIYSFDPSSNSFSKLYDFVFTNTTNSTGYSPPGSFIQATNGKLYAMTEYGGANAGNSGIGAGVIFSFDPATNTFTKIFDFGGTVGENPWSDLMQASDGKLYGVTTTGGANTVNGLGAGVIFSLDPSTNIFAKLYDFKRDGTGYLPGGNLVEAPDGKLYGTTYVTTPNEGGNGVIFSFDRFTNTYTDLYNFDQGNGTNPYGNLSLGSDGKIYGKTGYGGTTGGVVFSFDPSTSAYTELSANGRINPGTNLSRTAVAHNNSHLRVVNQTPSTAQGNDPAGGILEVPETGIVAKITSRSFCPGPTFPVTYKIGYSSLFNSGNTFKAQLSDANGSFASPTQIGTVTSATSGTIQAIIPSNTPNGSGYRIRVVSTNPVLAGTDNGINLSIGTATITTSSPTTFCPGSSVVLKATSGNSYSWSTGATTQSITVISSGSYTVTVAACGITAPVSVVVFPGATITSQPVSQTVSAGVTATFSVAATGAGLTYQWKKTNTTLADGSRISGATTNTLSISLVASTDASTQYKCVVTASSGCSVTSSNAVLTVNNAAPVISSQPTLPATTPCTSGTVSFTVAATGSGLTYQWYKGINPLSNGVNITGATTATLTINPLSISDTANYSVVVTNSLGSATSNSLNLTINARVVINSQPQASQFVCVNNAVSLTVGATGSGLTYKWRKNTTLLSDHTNSSGSVISGSQTATLTISNAQTTDAATNYNCQIIGTCNTVISANANITVGAPATPGGTITVSGGVNAGTIICPAGDTKTCSVASSLGATVYTWSVPPTTTGVSINGGGTTGTGQSVTVSFNPAFVSTTVVLSVVAGNACGNSTAKTVTFTNGRPPQPSAITGGSTSVCPAGLITGYHITDAGLTYNWTVTGDAVVTGSGSTATVKFGTAFPVTLSVTASNGCGTSLTRTLVINQNTGGSCSAVLNLKVYIQGSYMVGGTMQSPLYNSAPVTNPDPAISDYIQVELHNQLTPGNVVSSVTTMLHTDGTAQVIFPGVTNGTYWLVLKHRNSIETWSKMPVTIAPIFSYSFTGNP